MASGDGYVLLSFLIWGILILCMAADLPGSFAFCYSDFWAPAGIKSLKHELYIHQTFKLWFPKIRVPKGGAVQQTSSRLDNYLSFQQSVSLVALLFPQCPKGCGWNTASWVHATDSHATPSRVSIVHEQKASWKLVLAWNPIVFENPEAVNPSTQLEVES